MSCSICMSCTCNPSVWTRLQLSSFTPSSDIWQSKLLTWSAIFRRLRNERPCVSRLPPSRSNCTLFCLGVQFVPTNLLHIPNSRKIFNIWMKVICREQSLSSLFRILRQGLTTVFPAMCIVLPQQKVRKIDYVRSTCLLVGLKDLQRFSVHLLLVYFGHYRPLAASQVTGWYKYIGSMWGLGTWPWPPLGEVWGYSDKRQGLGGLLVTIVHK